jgi:hypothetical protein
MKILIFGLIAIAFVFLFIPTTIFAETLTFNVSGGEKIEKEMWLPSGSVDYSILVSGGDEKIIVELFDPKFNSLNDGWLTKSYSNTIFTDSHTAAFGNLGPRHPSSEGIHTFTFYNPDSTDRNVKLRLDVSEYNTNEEERQQEHQEKHFEKVDERHSQTYLYQTIALGATIGICSVIAIVVIKFVILKKK